MQEPYQALSKDEEAQPKSKKRLQLAGAGCCCCFLVLLVLNYAIKSFLSGLAITGFLTIDRSYVRMYCGDDFTIENSAEKIWTPGCGADKNISALGGCGAPCYSDELLEDWDAFNKKEGGTKVSYPSRGKEGVPVVQLGGWWLPADPAKGGPTSPRIVVQHGFTSNSNKHRQMIAAYFLRSLGFNVLVNNFRDHCYSGNGTGIYEWGHAYPYDLLGAWDYAVKDPENVLGGPVDASKVGLFGFSKGAFTTVNAFGLEAQVPAAWADGPPFTPEAVFQEGLRRDKTDPTGLLAPVYGSSIWSAVYQAAKDKGIDLDDNLPKKVLPKGPKTQRPIMWVHNKQDMTVPFSEGEHLEALVETMPEQYNLSKMMFDDSCTTNIKDDPVYVMNHCQDHLRHPTAYKERLCSFWQAAFSLDASFCGHVV